MSISANIFYTRTCEESGVDPEKYKDDIKRITTKLPIKKFQDGVDGIIEKRYAKVVLLL